VDSSLPLYTILYNNIGHSQLKTGNYTGALASYSRALKDLDNKQVLSREDTAAILNNMGRCNFQREEFAEALEPSCTRRPMNVEGLSMAAIIEMLLLRFSILLRLTHAELSNTTEAISSCKKFMSIGILTLGKNHLDISRVRVIVGQRCHNNNDLEGASEHFLTLALKSSRTTVGGPDDETIALVLNKLGNETAWWFPVSSSSTCTSLASCLGLSDNNLKVLTSAAGRRWFQIMRTANIHISKLEHNKEWYHMLGSEEESIRLSIKQQISGKVSKPSWVQNIPSVRADQPPLFLAKNVVKY